MRNYGHFFTLYLTSPYFQISSELVNAMGFQLIDFFVPFISIFKTHEISSK